MKAVSGGSESRRVPYDHATPAIYKNRYLLLWVGGTLVLLASVLLATSMLRPLRAVEEAGRPLDDAALAATVLHGQRQVLGLPEVAPATTVIAAAEPIVRLEDPSAPGEPFIAHYAGGWAQGDSGPVYSTGEEAGFLPEEAGWGMIVPATELPPSRRLPEPVPVRPSSDVTRSSADSRTRDIPAETPAANQAEASGVEATEAPAALDPAPVATVPVIVIDPAEERRRAEEVYLRQKAEELEQLLQTVR